MNDEEWERWKNRWAAQDRPIPTVLKRARTDRARALIGFAGIYAIALAVLAAAITELRRPESPMEASAAVVEIVFIVAIVVGVHVAMRGTLARRARAGTPLELLADLERRHAGRRRLLWLLPRATGLLIACTAGVMLASMIAARRFDLPTTLAMLVASSFTVWFVRAGGKRIGRIIDRELREAAEVRRLLDPPE